MIEIKVSEAGRVTTLSGQIELYYWVTFRHLGPDNLYSWKNNFPTNEPLLIPYHKNGHRYNVPDQLSRANHTFL